MLVIAENLNVRNKAYIEVVKSRDKQTIESLYLIVFSPVDIS